MKYNIKNKLLILILIIELFACNNAEKSLIGDWAIDTISYNENNIISYLTLNILEFNNRNQCEVPVTIHNLYEREGEWEIIKTDSAYYLNIKTENFLFNGRYSMFFDTDESQKLLRMILISDNMYIECSKMLYNIDYHRKELKELPMLNKKGY